MSYINQSSRFSGILTPLDGVRPNGGPHNAEPISYFIFQRIVYHTNKKITPEGVIFWILEYYGDTFAIPDGVATISPSVKPPIGPSSVAVIEYVVLAADVYTYAVGPGSAGT